MTRMTRPGFNADGRASHSLTIYISNYNYLANYLAATLSTTRGHNYKLFKPQATSRGRSTFFTVREPSPTLNFFFFFPGLDGLPLPTTTTPRTKKARAGQLNKKDQITESLKVPVLINAAHLRRGIRGAMRDGPTSTYAHCT